ncbi:right-handed parallel beta-helix repeat-containing protein [Methylomarinum vadi]|uniref:right-handed parallel beta-helix repeat-containing protein n=1 Tax=Methylomarinum vadi TaxID=438855 RepID=UPI00068E0CF0|nr:right-handed parallel beta-helix repeat-containing protein [Methylomarinum vadi]
MRVKNTLVSLVLLLPLCSSAVFGKVYRVGPNERFQRPSELVNRVVSGDVVEILSATYLNDEAVWRTDNLTIRGVGQRPRLHIGERYKIANRKAIWVIAGDNMRIENIEFSGAHVPDLNGAGLRVEGGNLTVENCYFHHNEFGILTGKLAGTLSVLNSEFAYQHRKGTFAHGVYVGDVEHFIFRGNYVHHSDGGHHVKSRARRSEILYNFLSDGADGQSSYAIDLPNCGDALVIGNVLLQGEGSINHSAIAYGAEGCAGKPVSLAVVHNSFVNRYPEGGFFVNNHTRHNVLIANNLVMGQGKLAFGLARPLGNRQWPLCGGSDAHVIGCLSSLDAGNGVSLPEALLPDSQYRHPSSTIPRTGQGKLKIGSFAAGGF